MLGTAALILLAQGVLAQTLSIGLKDPIRSIDPHFYNIPSNNAFSRHIFESLVITDANLAIRPGLAASWRRPEDTTWEFTLRQGIKFHDGSEFTADDVLFSYARAANLPHSPAGYSRYTRRIVAVDKIGPYHLRIKTDRPYPLLLQDLSSLRIMSLNAAEGKTTGEIDAGQGAVGTGPYRLVAWQPGKPAVLERNTSYWGAAPLWEKVVIIPLAGDEARVSALRRGDVQLIDALSPTQLKKLRGNRNITLEQRVSNQLIFLQVDSGRNSSPYVTGVRGRNPLRNARVRQAISQAIDRKTITGKLMSGAGVPAGQLLPKGVPGALRELQPDKYDPRAARRLLARAGYPRGFSLTLHGPRSHFSHDVDVLNAVATGLKRIGIAARTESKPNRIFFPMASKRKFSVFLAGWRLEAGDAAGPLRALLATASGRDGLGSSNFGGFSNPDLDEALAAALGAMDDDRRTKLLQEATRIAMRSYGIVPLYFEVNSWALRKGLRFQPRVDGATLAMNLSPAK